MSVRGGGPFPSGRRWVVDGDTEGWERLQHAVDVGESADPPPPSPPPPRISDPGPPPGPAPEPLPNLPCHLGSYDVTERLGVGGFGVVYKGRDRAIGRDVAIKVPRPDRVTSPEDVNSFLAEARKQA